MLQLENCDIIFHFNKASITDPSIPPWVVKVKGQTFYVNHVTSTAAWSTKETPDNSSTKGAIKFKHANITIDELNNAYIHPCNEMAIV